MNKNVKILVASLLCSLTFTCMNANAEGPRIARKSSNSRIIDKYNNENNYNHIRKNSKFRNIRDSYRYKEEIEEPSENIFEKIDLGVHNITILYNDLIDRYENENNIPIPKRNKYNSLIEQLNKYCIEKYNELILRDKFSATRLKNYYKEKIQFIVKLDDATQETEKIYNRANKKIRYSKPKHKKNSLVENYSITKDKKYSNESTASEYESEDLSAPKYFNVSKYEMKYLDNVTKNEEIRRTNNKLREENEEIKEEIKKKIIQNEKLKNVAQEQKNLEETQRKYENENKKLKEKLEELEKFNKELKENKENKKTFEEKKEKLKKAQEENQNLQTQLKEI